VFFRSASPFSSTVGWLELFEHLVGNTSMWDLLLASLQAWRQTVPEQITLNYDTDPQATLTELQVLPIGAWHKIIFNDALWEGAVIQTLFPNGASLRQLQHNLQQQGMQKYRIGRGRATHAELAHALSLKLNRYYGAS
jgi:hypothetical protein